MMRCNKCNINFNGNMKQCPLCGYELVGKNSKSVFPKIDKKKELLLNKILLFATLCIGIIFSFVEYYIAQNLFYSKYVIVGLITNYISVRFICNNYRNFFKVMNNYFLIMFLLLFVLYFISKSLVITTYIIPILCIVVFLFNSISMIVLHDSFLIKYLKTIIIDGIIGIVPLLFVLLKLSTFVLLSYICFILDILVFIGIIIFFKDIILEEIKKIFNF